MDGSGSGPASSEDCSPDLTNCSSSGLANSEGYSADTEIDTRERCNNKLKSKTGKKRKFHKTEDESNKDSKKSTDDETSQEVPVATEEAGTSTKRKRKDYIDEEEAAVNDEDIDKFCDEINEEDNQQYEMWVQLLEAKLNPNKKRN